MPNGYTGKLLFVDLSTGEIHPETPEDRLYRDYIGSYGIGARVLYDRMRPGVAPLGPENLLGLVTGPLTGTPATMGSRFQAVGKSPLTGGWGDANAGGHFGPRMKFAGYDGVFLSGIAESPVYLFIDNGRAELRDAGDLWGADVYETEARLKGRHGGQARVACIGPAGEKQTLIASIINEKGAAAGRSGLGAVMGSKKLKAVVARGNIRFPIADLQRVQRIRDQHLAEMHATKTADGESQWERMRKYGTSGGTAEVAHSGDTPIKNFAGVGIVDYPDVGTVSGDGAIHNQVQNMTCWGCPQECEGILGPSTGKYRYEAGLRRAEYETLASFGGYVLNNDVEAVNKANDICNRAGIDTISVGTTVAFAIECFENGILTTSDTDGIELCWGDGPGIVALTEKIARREGIGEVLADGVKIAAERIGKGAEEFAVHIGGQELGMHDPKNRPGLNPTGVARYVGDATPGRHTQGFGRGAFELHLFNAAGVCMFGYGSGYNYILADFISAVTGWERSWDELTVCMERVMAMRQAFNSREGINNRRDWPVHPRIAGIPPDKEGPNKGVTLDIDDQLDHHTKALGWDLETFKPTREKLLELGMDDVARDLW